jgi:hypothetical protein
LVELILYNIDIAAGEFPSSDNDDTTTDDDFPPMMARRGKKTAFQDENGHFLRNWKPNMDYRNGTDNGYKAQLVKVWSATSALDESLCHLGLVF